MIAILLNDDSFEQDIRELLMAFFPGETDRKSTRLNSSHMA